MDNFIRLKDGFEFDFATMLGMERIQPEDLKALEPKIERAALAIEEMRQSGYAKAHLSKDGQPEPVYFTRLPYIKDGNPIDICYSIVENYYRGNSIIQLRIKDLKEREDII